MLSSPTPLKLDLKAFLLPVTNSHTKNSANYKEIEEELTDKVRFILIKETKKIFQLDEKK